MERVIGKIIIGLLLFSNFCASPLLANADAHEHSSHHAEIKAATDHQNLACCENHEKETGPIASLNSSENPGKLAINFSPSNKLNKIPELQKKPEQTEVNPPPTHKYLASVIRLE